MSGLPSSGSGHRPRSSLSSTMRSNPSSRAFDHDSTEDRHETSTTILSAHRSPRNLSHENLPRQVRFSTTTGTHVAHGRVQKSRHRDHSSRHESAAVTAATNFLRRTRTPIPDTQPQDNIEDPDQTQLASPSPTPHRRHHSHSGRTRLPAPVTISPEEDNPPQVIKPSTPRTPLADITPPSSTTSASMMMAETQSTVAFETEFERVEYVQQNSPRPRSMPSLNESVNLLTAEEARRLLLLYAESTPSLAGLIQEIAYTRVSRRRERINSSRVMSDGS
ncbi:hypothetical protein QBC38DRAFT_126018 [Podospora fimiseda]|uniref:Uncharacterized protein n=1 Tax=Podospora fimiseda TaxID=252190 RepID=A0AAN7BFE3_9PEZI|nr:hypothetical protein QBC38DRAFT_126018 [Podospora fimiseda]